MSRTYRKQLIACCPHCLKPKYKTYTLEHKYDCCECDDHKKDYSSNGFFQLELHTPDMKPWYKPPKDFKQMNRQQDRSREKEALYNHLYKEKDYIPPINKKRDEWEWN